MSWQVTLSLTSPTLHAAAPDVDVPPPFALNGAAHFRVIQMATLVAWPQQGEEGSGSQYEWHFIEGSQEDATASSARKLRQEDHTIPISRDYMRGPCR